VAGPGGALAPTPHGTRRDNLEAIVVAFILALCIRHYAMEAFVIPTGSMATTLLGAHLDVACTNCGKEQPVSDNFARSERGPHGGRLLVETCPDCGAHVVVTAPASAAREPLEVTCRTCKRRLTLDPRPLCSNCGYSLEEAIAKVDRGLWPFGGVSRGDRILVDKMSYKVGRPERFDVLVFKFPLNPQQSYIKRLLGLSGELVALRAGDVFVDGAIARKPRRVQERLWRPVHESRYAERDGGGPRGPAFKTAGGGSFEPVAGGFRGRSDGADAWLVYARPIRDLTSYNEPPRNGGDRILRDIRVVFDATIRRPGERTGPAEGIIGRLSADDDAFTFLYPLAGGQAELRHGDAAVATSAVPALPTAEAVRFDFGRADARITLDVDGKTIFEHDIEPADRDPRRSEVRFGLRGHPLEATFTEVGVYRDVYYAHGRIDLQTTTPGRPLDRELIHAAVLQGQLPGYLKTSVERILTKHLRAAFGRRDLKLELPYGVAPGYCFVVGDNSSNSTDGRYWGVVPVSHLVGRAYVVFWPALPGDFAVRPVR